MKKAAACIFLFAYVIMLCKPVTPIISDAFAHVLFYSQHMATVHYENGKMHVHKDLMQKASEENSSNDQGLLKKNQATEEYIYSGYNSSASLTTTKKPSCIMLAGIISELSPGITTPPPRFI